MIDVSIIIPSTRPKSLPIVLDAISRQKHAPKYEIIIVLEAEDHSIFQSVWFPPAAKIIQQPLHNDFGAAAKDAGIKIASGHYVVFWDDDNLYYDYALLSQHISADKYDIGIVRAFVNGEYLPRSNNEIALGNIDTMCLCVKTSLAKTKLWADGCGRGSDYRWYARLMTENPRINYSKQIIGIHL
jgi:glycosyltransferase involved in cell wall biosynthesis